jgi:hypothetical protein
MLLLYVCGERKRKKEKEKEEWRNLERRSMWGSSRSGMPGKSGTSRSRGKQFKIHSRVKTKKKKEEEENCFMWESFCFTLCYMYVLSMYKYKQVRSFWCRTHVVCDIVLYTIFRGSWGCGSRKSVYIF